MAKLSYSPIAREDIKDLAAYIARDKPMAARKWAQRVRRKCRLIARNNELGDAHEELGVGIRSTYPGDYIIFFRAGSKVVEILRVIRGDRDIKFL